MRGDNVAFFEDTQRRVKQTAFFGSADFDVIPKILTVTAGARHYKFENSLKGSVSSSFSCFEAGIPPGGCTSGNTNLDAKNLSDTESGTKPRYNIAWHVTPDILLYATYSQGFRPGNFNRQGSDSAAYIPGPDGKPQFAIPKHYSSDDLTNKEIGWKSEFFNHRLQWNGAVYQENWDNVQIGFFDPGQTGNLAFGTNGQNFRIRGVETPLSRADAAGRSFLELQRTDQLTGIARHQSGQREFRQADHRAVRKGDRHRLRANQQPVWPAREPECQLAADSVQLARALRLERQRL
jgi:outer membrane receptor protein involved in Fe transport